MKKTQLRTIILLISMTASATQFVCAQKKSKKVTPSPLTIAGSFTINNTSKSKIYNYLLKEEMELVEKKQSTIIAADSAKGEFTSKRTAWCSYKADTTFNGKVIKDAVDRKEAYEYAIKFNAGNNIFTYEIPSFKTLNGNILMKNDANRARLSSCAESESWTIRDIITGESILIGMK